MSNWRQSHAVAITAVVLFIFIQLAIPISRLGAGDVAPRFAWQMFSEAVPAPSFQVETNAGMVDIALDDYMARPRSDIEVERLMPPHLCAVIPGAERIIWENASLEC